MSNTDVNALGRPELEAIANDLGIKFRADMKDDTLRGKIAEALGEAAPEDTQPAVAPTLEDAPKPEKRYTVIIAKDATDKQPVPVSVNGKNYIIKRGEKVKVPASVVAVLQNAVQFIYDPETLEREEVHSYPFQVLSEA